MGVLREKPYEGQEWRPLQLNLQEHPYPGRFITFEGVDGSGKSSLITLLAQYLQERGQAVLITKTPTDDVRNTSAWRAWSDGSQGVDRSNIHGYGLSILAFGDRLVHQRACVEPSLKAGTWVLCDRYILTSVAYESGPIHAQLAELLIRPDLGVLVDVLPDEALHRIRQREHEDEHPDDAHEIPLLQRRYLELSRLNKHIVITTTRATLEQSFRQLKPHIDCLLEGGRQ